MASVEGRSVGQSLVAMGTDAGPHVDVTRAMVETLMELTRAHGYEGCVVGSRAEPDFTVRYYACDADLGGWAVVEQVCPIPYWRIAEGVARRLSRPVMVVELEIDVDGHTRLSESRVRDDGQIEKGDVESYDDEPADSIKDAEARLMSALDWASDHLTRSTWGYLRRAGKRRRR
jgi:hypothetical protein